MVSDKIRLALIFLVALGSHSVQADQSAAKLESVKIGLPDFAPYSIMNKVDGSCSGLGIDFLETLFKKYDVKPIIFCSSPSRIYNEIKNGNIDLTINVKTTKVIEKWVEYTDIPFDLLSISLYERSAPSKAQTISGVRDFDYVGLRDKFIAQGYEFVDVATTTDSARLFLSGRTDFLISYKRPYDKLIQENSDYHRLAENVKKTPLLEVMTYIGIPYESQNFDKIKHFFNKIDKSSAEYLINTNLGEESVLLNRL